MKYGKKSIEKKPNFDAKISQISNYTISKNQNLVMGGWRLLKMVSLQNFDTDSLFLDF